MSTLSKLALRDLLIQSLAPGSDPINAIDVLVTGIGQIQRDVWSASLAITNVGPAGKNDFLGTLLGISERAKALKLFASECLDVNFQPLGDEHEGGAL